MIPLGSCTMKLNSDASMMPITQPHWANIHPFVSKDQIHGYHKMLSELEHYLIKITGMDGISMQPNSGSNGEYAGLIAIKKYQEENGQKKRNKCIIPTSAHGTNFASAKMAGMDIIPLKSTESGKIDLNLLNKLAKIDDLSCFMVTYPSTYGVFEEQIVKICEIIHDNGGQV